MSAGGFLPVTHTYTSGTAATETIPSGATFLTIKVGGDGGSGGGNNVDGGGGGGGGAYCESDGINVASSGGKTLIYTVGPGGAAPGTNPSNGNSGTGSTVSSGTFSLTSMVAGGGLFGHGVAVFTGGAGGTATGGTTTNTSGTAGGNGNGAGSTGSGGAAAGGFPGSGSNGYLAGNGTAGSAGQIQFIYT